MGMTLIGLTGRRGSGKDTAFQFISEWAERRGLLAVRRGFGDKLKVSAAKALGFDLADEDALVIMNSLKNGGEIATTVLDQSILLAIDGREFLQRYGTEAHRDVFGEDFWVDALLPIAPEHEVNVNRWQKKFIICDPATNAPMMPDFAVVTDVRFKNEAQRIKDLGGVIWEIYRPGEGQDAHVSEAGLPRHFIDKTIDNDASIEAFQATVNSAMTGSFHMKLNTPQEA